MVGSVEWTEYLIRYGRTPVQDFVTKGQNVTDAVHYIRAEKYFEIAKLTSFVTGDLRNFEKRPAFGSRPWVAEGEGGEDVRRTAGVQTVPELQMPS